MGLLSDIDDVVDTAIGIVKLVFWIGVTTLLYYVVSSVLFPTEYLLIPG